MFKFIFLCLNFIGYSLLTLLIVASLAMGIGLDWLILAGFIIAPVVAILLLKNKPLKTSKAYGLLALSFVISIVFCTFSPLSTLDLEDTEQGSNNIVNVDDSNTSQTDNLINNNDSSNKDKSDITNTDKTDKNTSTNNTTVDNNKDTSSKNDTSNNDKNTNGNSTNTNDLFKGYTLIEVDGGNLSGTRKANVVVDIGYGDREYWAFTNEHGQLVKVIADKIILQDESKEKVTSDGRYYSDEAKVPGTERSDLDEGHVIADSLGGVSNAYNITPQDSTLNRHGDQAYMEEMIRQAGGCTDFVAIITYPDTKTQIPSYYSFTYTLKGNVIKDEFPNENPEKEISISLNKSSLLLTVGKTSTLKATVDGSSDTVTWKSSNTSVATVNSSGKVTAKKAGTVTITASVGDKSDTCKVTVKAAATSSTNSTDKSNTTNDNTSVSCYVTKTGSKYHSIPNCGRTKSATKTTVKEAKAKGLEPCSKCW